MTNSTDNTQLKTWVPLLIFSIMLTCGCTSYSEPTKPGQFADQGGAGAFNLSGTPAASYCYSDAEVAELNNEMLDVFRDLVEPRRYYHGIRRDVEYSPAHGITMNNVLEIPEEVYLEYTYLYKDYAVVDTHYAPDGVERMVSLKFLVPADAETEFSPSEVQGFVKGYMEKRARYFNTDFSEIEFGKPVYHDWDSSWEMGIARKKDGAVSIPGGAQFTISNYGVVYHFLASEDAVGTIVAVPDLELPATPKISKSDAERIAKLQDGIPQTPIIERAEMSFKTVWSNETCIDYWLLWTIDFSCTGSDAKYDKIIIDALDGSVVAKTFKCYAT
ncbi:MAG: hypothetical protein ABH829_05215 [archaeon]